jgi:ABC-2 type transport system ATP-binding protein
MKPDRQVPPTIRIEGLEKQYQETQWWGKRRKTQAVGGLSLQVLPGEAYGLVGPNGAGKSSVIKILLGLNSPSAGQAWIAGEPAGTPASREGLGYVPENPSLIPELTVWETVYTGARLHGQPTASAGERVHSAIQRLGLEDHRTVKARNLSKGLAQRAALATALAGNPDTLILDEPLSGLDPVWRRKVTDLLMGLRDEGKTLFFSSHILADVERLADRVGLLHAGQLKAEARPRELLTDHLQGYSVRSRGVPLPPEWDTVREGQEEWRTHLPPDSFWEGLEALRAAKHQIIDVQPVGGDLESVLFSYLEPSD